MVGRLISLQHAMLGLFVLMGFMFIDDQAVRLCLSDSHSSMTTPRALSESVEMFANQPH